MCPDEKPNELLTRNKHICTQISETHTHIHTHTDCAPVESLRRVAVAGRKEKRKKGETLVNSKSHKQKQRASEESVQ